MDTSKTYIKMCDHPKIQKEWKPADGDWVGSLYKSGEYQWHPHPIVADCIHDVVTYAKNKVWLPRQDQIQEMIWKKYYFSFISELDFIIQKIKKDKKKAQYYWEQFMSWEQLWLAFYMYEKHKLIWNGEKWQRK